MGQTGYPQYILSIGHSYSKTKEARELFNIRREKCWKFLKIAKFLKIRSTVYVLGALKNQTLIVTTLLNSGRTMVMKYQHDVHYYSAVPSWLFQKSQISWDVAADAGFLCSKVAMLVVVTKEVLHILSVSVALVIQHAARLRHIFICGLSCSAVFFYIISLTARFSKKKLVNIKYVFLIFSATIV